MRMKPAVEVARHAVGPRWAHVETIPKRLRHSMHVPLCFSKLAPSGHPGKKEMFETPDLLTLGGANITAATMEPWVISH
jgi:hypothetical protein